MPRVARALALGFAVALGAARANAQSEPADPSRTEAARTLFEEGLALVDQARWPEAADKFRRALELRPSPVITFNLASALAKQGKVIEASELLHTLDKDDTVKDDARAAAEQLRAEVERQIARLTIDVRGDVRAHTVSLDGRSLHVAELGVALPVDPGSHQIVAKRDQLALFTRDVSLAPGATRSVTLDLAGSRGDAIANRGEAHTAPDAADDDDANWLPWIGVGAVAAGLVTAIIVIAVAPGS